MVNGALCSKWRKQTGARTPAPLRNSMSIEDFSVDDGYECPTCEKVLNTSLGLKQHHTKVHGETLRQTDTCNWCGDTFHPRPSQVGNFCSRGCQMERRKAEGLKARKRRVVVQCPGCGEGFEVRYSEVGHKVYCSDECRQSGTNSTELVCEQCGGAFRATGKYADDARFCSQDCYGAWISANKSGPNSVHWKGGDIPRMYGPGWGERKRQMVRERDGYECTRCGMPDKQHRDEYGQQLHVHHEAPARASTNPAVYNAPRNLRTLCVSCHHVVEAE